MRGIKTNNMLIEQSNKLLSAFREGLNPVSDIPLYQWITENIDLPNIYNPAGTFNIDFYPYLKAPMDDLLDPNIKQVNAACCTQAGKSLMQQLFIPFIILEDCGPTLMIHDTTDNAKKCAEERILPLLKSVKKIKSLLDSQRFSARKSGVLLPHMSFRISGPAESNLLGYTARYILGDEVWQWQATNHVGTLEKLENRQTAYNATRKILLTSQPDYEGSEWHKQCEKGSWLEFGFRCPHCNLLQRYVWNEEADGKEYGMIMDKTPIDSKGHKDYDKKASTARLVCGGCFGEITDTAENRRNLVTNGEYILIHEGKNKEVRTYSWPQYVNRSVSFKQIALKYLDAVIEKRTTGLRNKHQIFQQQTLGHFWKTGQVIDTPILMTEAYSSNDEWKDETIRFLTIDPQKDYINWLIRSWSNKVPESRLIDFGTVIGFSEIEDIVKKYKIHPLSIALDSGYQGRNCYAESVQRGKVINLANGKRHFATWLNLKGDGGTSTLSPKKFYTHKLTDNGKTIDLPRLYSPEQTVDPQFPVGHTFKPIMARLHSWSNYSIKTILCGLRDKKLPFNWRLNERATGEYNKQMFSEELNYKSGRFEQIEGIPNHIFDMECMQLVLSLMAGCYIPAAETLNNIEKSPELK